MKAVVGGEATVPCVCWKNVIFGHVSGLHCQMTKQFSNEFHVLHLQEKSPWIKGAQYIANSGSLFLSKFLWSVIIGNAKQGVIG